jgi:cyclopropane fatty-acyl-phospholipid synthase-like methyltransferase
MMEHVGVFNFDDYFNVVRERLTDDGFAMIHSIGRMTPPGTTGPFFRKYIFPGGYVPALSETFASLERCGLWVCDVEVLRLHYAWTLRDWRLRFARKPRSQPRRSMTSASAACGSFISPPPSLASSTAPTWSSSCCSPASATPCR